MFSAIRRVIFAAAGTSDDLVGTDRTEVTRYLCLGLSVLVTSVAALVSMTFALALVFGPPAWQYLPFSLFWGLLIYNIDRWLVSTVDYGRLDETNVGDDPQRRSRFVGYAARFALAAVVAIVIAEPVVLTVFAPEVNAQIAVAQTEQRRAASAEVDASFAPRQQEVDKPYEEAVEAKRVTAERLADANRALDEEQNGTGGTRRVGCDTRAGGRCQQRINDLQAAQEGDRQAGVALAGATTEHNRAVDALSVEKKQVLDARNAKIGAADGLAAREAALATLTREDSAIFASRWTITGLFLLVDLLPLVLKIFSPHSLTERRVRRNAATRAIREDDEARLERERDRRRHGSGMYGVAQYDVVVRDRIDAERDLDRARVRMKKTVDMHAAHREHGLDEEFFETDAGPAGSAGPKSGSARERPSPSPRAARRRILLNGRWEIVGPVPGAQRGGFGEVFLGVDVFDDSHEVVVKRVRGGSGLDPDQRRRGGIQLQREQRWQSAVRSPYVATVLDTGEDPLFGSFLVTPFFRNGTLQDRLRSENFTLSLEYCLRIIEQILTGLVDCMNMRGIVHLDIKPANVALDDEGRVQLIDFGLAHLLENPDELRSSGTPVFTRWYSPPEQILRVTPGWNGSACDVRAVGATLYALLIGHPPLWREGVERGLIHRSGQLVDPQRESELLDLLLTSVPADPRTVLPDLPESVARLVLRWLQVDPAVRASGGPSAVHRALAALQEVKEDVVMRNLESLPVGYNRVRGFETGSADDGHDDGEQTDETEGEANGLEGTDG